MPRKKTVQRAKVELRAGKRPTTAAGEFVREEIEHVLQENWSFAPRLLAAGLAMIAAGLTRRSLPGYAAAAGTGSALRRPS